MSGNKRVRNIPPAETLRKILRYEPETGKLFWRHRPIEMFRDGKQSATHNCAAWNGCHADREAFTANDSRGYKQGRIFNQNFSAHRIIWTMQTGRPPKNKIDHINGDGCDNRMCNLREATHTENMRNARCHVDARSPYRGVSWSSKTQKWRTRISTDNGIKCIGFFVCEKEAARAFDEAAKKYHGEFARLNFP